MYNFSITALGFLFSLQVSARLRYPLSYLFVFAYPMCYLSTCYILLPY